MPTRLRADRPAPGSSGKTVLASFACAGATQLGGPFGPCLTTRPPTQANLWDRLSFEGAGGGRLAGDSVSTA